MHSPKKLLRAAICLLAVIALCVAVPFAAVADDNEDIPAPTGEGRVVYLQPNENWLADDAWFALYYFDYNDNYGHVAMTDEDGDGVYEAQLPLQFPNFLFYRVDSAAAEFDGEYVLNQTDCFEYAPEYSCYVLEADSWELGQWEAAEPLEENVTEPVTEPSETETEVTEEPAPETEATEAEPEVTEEPAPETEAPETEPEVTEEPTVPAEE